MVLTFGEQPPISIKSKGLKGQGIKIPWEWESNVEPLLNQDLKFPE